MPKAKWKRRPDKKPDAAHSKRQAEYAAYLKSPEWKAFRADILWERGAGCQCCGVTKKSPHIHHLTYDRFGQEKPEDVAVLCAECHAAVHGNYTKLRKRAADEAEQRAKAKVADFKKKFGPKPVTKEELVERVVQRWARTEPEPAPEKPKVRRRPAVRPSTFVDGETSWLVS